MVTSQQILVFEWLSEFAPSTEQITVTRACASRWITRLTKLQPTTGRRTPLSLLTTFSLRKPSKRYLKLVSSPLVWSCCCVGGAAPSARLLTPAHAPKSCNPQLARLVLYVRKPCSTVSSRCGSPEHVWKMQFVRLLVTQRGFQVGQFHACILRRLHSSNKS